MKMLNSRKCSQLRKCWQRLKMLTTGENAHNWWKCSQLRKCSQLSKMFTTDENTTLENAHSMLTTYKTRTAYNFWNRLWHSQQIHSQVLHTPTTQDKAPSSELIIRRPHVIFAIWIYHHSLYTNDVGRRSNANKRVFLLQSIQNKPSTMDLCLHPLVLRR